MGKRIQGNLYDSHLLTVNEVTLLLPDKKGIAQGREDEASQDLAGTGVGTKEAEAVCQ